MLNSLAVSLRIFLDGGQGPILGSRGVLWWERHRGQPRCRCQPVVRLNVCSSAWSVAPSLAQPWLSLGVTSCVCVPAGASSPSDSAAPAVVIRPHNSSVVSGSSQATLECVANARYGNTSTAPTGALGFLEKDGGCYFHFFIVVYLEIEAGLSRLRATLWVILFVQHYWIKPVDFSAHMRVQAGELSHLVLTWKGKEVLLKQ